MPCQILVSNISSVTKTDIILIADGDHVWGTRETMASWVASGNSKGDWDRVFSLVIVTDKTKEDLNYLLDELPDGRGKYHFLEPQVANPLYIDLYNNGQAEAVFDVVNQYILERT